MKKILALSVVAIVATACQKVTVAFEVKSYNFDDVSGILGLPPYGLECSVPHVTEPQTMKEVFYIRKPDKGDTIRFSGLINSDNYRVRIIIDSAVVSESFHKDGKFHEEYIVK